MHCAPFHHMNILWVEPVDHATNTKMLKSLFKLVHYTSSASSRNNAVPFVCTCWQSPDTIVHNACIGQYHFGVTYHDHTLHGKLPTDHTTPRFSNLNMTPYDRHPSRTAEVFINIIKSRSDLSCLLLTCCLCRNDFRFRFSPQDVAVAEKSAS